MIDVVSISEQLKQRRLDLGLSLAEVARRAGTSAATLSRYENGWSRFETYFDDAESEPMPQMLVPFDWKECKAFFIRQARAIVLPA